MRFLLIFIISCLIMGVTVTGDMSGNHSLSDTCLQLRDSISDSLQELDAQSSTVSLYLADPHITAEEEQELISSLYVPDSFIRSIALVGENGTIIRHYPDSSAFLDKRYSLIPMDGQSIKKPFVNRSFLYAGDMNEDDLFFTQDIIMPVRMRNAEQYLVLSVDCKKIAEDAVKISDLSPDMFAVLMNNDGDILWCSDLNELNTIPPENVLTEFPTFREAKELARYSWSGRTVYDVWDKNIVRSGVWSSIPVYNDAFKVFVAE